MGWNSWDCYGTSVTEAEVLANAEFMARRLLPYGWDTVVVDIQWHDPTARAGGYNENAPLSRDGYGCPAPSSGWFPSGFSSLAERIHGLGLRFGLHIMRGIPRLAVDRELPVLNTSFTAADVADRSSVCPWNTDNYGLDLGHPGAQAYYDSLGRLFAEWGVDFVKADDMLWPYHEREISAFAAGLRSSGRPMQLSLSPGRGLSTEHLDHLRENATMWRISDDLWDRWEDVYEQFARLSRWAPFIRPGAWPDADMLPLGRIGIRAERGVDRQSRLTPDEQRTLMSLWCIARSPLMFGGDLPTSSAETIDLLTSDAVLDVLRHSHGNREVIRDYGLVVWVAEAAGSSGRFAGLFNLEDQPQRVRTPLGDLGCRDDVQVTDLWTGSPVRVEDGALVTDLPAHGCALLRAA
jgi:alpha-galactosidase